MFSLWNPVSKHWQAGFDTITTKQESTAFRNPDKTDWRHVPRSQLAVEVVLRCEVRYDFRADDPVGVVVFVGFDIIFEQAAFVA